MADAVIPFAFWGRVSTEDRQDPRSSRAWQLTRAQVLIEPRGGQIVIEFFDVDKSRSVPPQRRPRAQALLAALADPNRGFEAVVVGEPQRAFYGNQFGNTFPLFVHYGVPLWVPEIGGPVDAANEAHDLIMSVFGGVSKGERNRVKIRVRTAMATQAQREGRFLGGRPPYGYVLIDAGPHPNPAKAADGKRLHTLAIDEPAATIVRRIFAEYTAGTPLAAIAARLTAENIPCPSGHDPQRNPHRLGLAWSKGAIRAIVGNPRYTGYQVWNRQRKDEVLIDVNDVALGHTTKQRWNDPAQWIYSSQPAHPAIIDTATFARAQELLATPNTHSPRRPRPTTRPYLLLGLLYCGICGRRMQGSWNNNQAYYRCRPPATQTPAGHPPGIYLREAAVIPPLESWLASALSPADSLPAATVLPRPIASATVEQPAEQNANLGEQPGRLLTEIPASAAKYAGIGLHLAYSPSAGTVTVRTQPRNPSTSRTDAYKTITGMFRITQLMTVPFGQPGQERPTWARNRATVGCGVDTGRYLSQRSARRTRKDRLNTQFRRLNLDIRSTAPTNVSTTNSR